MVISVLQIQSLNGPSYTRRKKALMLARTSTCPAETKCEDRRYARRSHFQVGRAAVFARDWADTFSDASRTFGCPPSRRSDGFHKIFFIHPIVCGREFHKVRLRLTAIFINHKLPRQLRPALIILLSDSAFEASQRIRAKMRMPGGSGPVRFVINLSKATSEMGIASLERLLNV